MNNMEVSQIEDYRIVHGDTPLNTAEEVRTLIGLGWQPFGFPFRGTNGSIYQAMVKYS